VSHRKKIFNDEAAPKTSKFLTKLYAFDGIRAFILIKLSIGVSWLVADYAVVQNK